MDRVPHSSPLGVLLEILPEKKAEAVALHQDFNWKFIATLPEEDFEMELDVSRWLNEAVCTGQW